MLNRKFNIVSLLFLGVLYSLQNDVEILFRAFSEDDLSVLYHHARFYQRFKAFKGIRIKQYDITPFPGFNVSLFFQDQSVQFTINKAGVINPSSQKLILTSLEQSDTVAKPVPNS